MFFFFFFLFLFFFFFFFFFSCRRRHTISYGDWSSDVCSSDLGDEAHRDVQGRAGDGEVEISGHREIAGEARILEVANARRSYAGGRQLIVEPCRCAVAEIGPNNLVQGREYLQKHEHDTDDSEGSRQGIATLHGAYERTHVDGEQRRQQTAQEQHAPPAQG